MHISVDLHSHSGASGGVGEIRLDRVAETMRRKGIRVFGTGDCLHEGWLATLEAALVGAEPGLFRLREGDAAARFLLQTEIILTAPVAGGGRKKVHCIFLFPSLGAARTVAGLLDGWSVKRSIGRPFLICADAGQVAERLSAIAAVDGGIEIIPAHVMTPDGIYGSNNPVTTLAEFFGEFARSIRVVETGLSADPLVLALIPELDTRALMSNSDGHCEALNRVGREYTTLDAADLSYDGLIAALRGRRIVSTAEFTPAEGRYFLTGHRPGKNGHGADEFCYYSPDCVPEGNQCPICGKTLTVGVLQRALELSRLQGGNRTVETARPAQAYRTLVPLIEVAAAGLSVRSIASRKVLSAYERLVADVGGEVGFWELPAAEAVARCERLDLPGIARAVGQIHAGDYAFAPLGYDGEYGELQLGMRVGWFGHAVVSGAGRERQGVLLSG